MHNLSLQQLLRHKGLYRVSASKPDPLRRVFPPRRRFNSLFLDRTWRSPPEVDSRRQLERPLEDAPAATLNLTYGRWDRGGNDGGAGRDRTDA